MKLNDAFQESVVHLDQELKQKSLDITEYLPSEFAKREILGDFDYIISAIFTEISIKRGIAEVYYPSVRVDALGYNVAIMPEFAYSSLQLVAAGDFTLYKKGNHIIVYN